MFQLNLERVVDRGESIRTDDLLDTKRALSDLGYYEKPTGGFADFTDDEMFEGIEAFQRDKRLRVDGMMVPDGPTVRTINAALVARGADGPANNGAGDGGGRRPHVPIGLLLARGGGIVLGQPSAGLYGQSAFGSSGAQSGRGNDSLAGGSLNKAIRQPGLATPKVFGYTGKVIKKFGDDTIERSEHIFDHVGKTIGGLFGSGSPPPKFELPPSLEWNRHSGYVEKQVKPATTKPNAGEDKKRSAPGIVRIRTEGPIRIDHLSGAAWGIDGVDYDIRWYPLNENGERMTVFETVSKSPPNSGFGKFHTPFEGIINDASNSTYFQPPFVSRHGYEVKIHVPPQPQRNGVSKGITLDFYGSRFKAGHKSGSQAINPPIDSQDDFR